MGLSVHFAEQGELVKFQYCAIEATAVTDPDITYGHARLIIV